MYSYIKAVKDKPTPPRLLSDAVRTILMSDAEVWEKIEPYLLNGGIEGSVQFDHMKVVDILREWDKNGELKDTRKGAKIWEVFKRQIRKGGFLLEKGRVTGLQLGADQKEPGEPEEK